VVLQAELVLVAVTLCCAMHALHPSSVSPARLAMYSVRTVATVGRVSSTGLNAFSQNLASAGVTVAEANYTMEVVLATHLPTQLGWVDK
jgi:hypothetical protein